MHYPVRRHEKQLARGYDTISPVRQISCLDEKAGHAEKEPKGKFQQTMKLVRD